MYEPEMAATYDISNKIRLAAETSEEEVELAAIIANRLIRDREKSGIDEDKRIRAKYLSFIKGIISNAKSLQLSEDALENIGYELINIFKCTTDIADHQDNE